MKIKNFYLNNLKNEVKFRLRVNSINPFIEEDNLDETDKVFIKGELKSKIKKFKIGLVKDLDTPPYYSKYERFLKNNDLAYEYYNIYSSNWLEEAKKYDVIIWRVMSNPWELEDAKEKIYFIEKVLNKKIYPSYNEIIYYENKVYQHYFLKEHKCPIIDCFISTDYEECLDKINEIEFPVVSKIKTGATSAGVRLVKNKKQAKKLIEKVFRQGATTCWPFLKQKNYIYFQEFVPNKGFDLRIIVMDEDNIFGYYRNAPKNDFRASGMGLVEKKELPKKAIRLALQVLNETKFTNLAVDFLQSTIDDNYYIIETSNFIQVETDKQLEINGVPGRYMYDVNNDELKFEKGTYWLQEVVLKKFLENVI